MPQEREINGADGETRGDREGKKGRKKRGLAGLREMDWGSKITWKERMETRRNET